MQVLLLLKLHFYLTTLSDRQANTFKNFLYFNKLYKSVIVYGQLSIIQMLIELAKRIRVTRDR